MYVYICLDIMALASQQGLHDLCMYVCMYVYIHIHIHTYIHTYIYVCIHMFGHYGIGLAARSA